MISMISMLGIAIAVAVLIVVLSVVNGFERELKDRLLAMSAHASIEDASGELDRWQLRTSLATDNARVTAAAPYVDGQALLVFGHQLSGAELRGIDPRLENEVSGVSRVITQGDLSDLAAGSFNIVLGVELAQSLGVQIGDRVTATLAEGIVTPAGVLPRMKRFVVSGIYRVGMYEFDRRLAFINIADAQKLFRKADNVSGIRLAVTDIYAAADIVREVAIDAGGGVLVSDWTRRHVNFFRSIQITKSILFVILLMVVAVAAFNIVSTLVMVVTDMRIFVTQGSIIGVAGTFAGLVLGVVFTLNLEEIVNFMEATFGIKFLAADVYFISDLPADLRWSDVVRICAIALVLALLSTLYPAWRGARTMPAEALRYE
jgi:lipoprotein-releasing system permease protein